MKPGVRVKKYEWNCWRCAKVFNSQMSKEVISPNVLLWNHPSWISLVHLLELREDKQRDILVGYSCPYACHLHVHTNTTHPFQACLSFVLLCTYFCTCECLCCCVCLGLWAHVHVCLHWTANSLCQKISCSKNLDLRKCPLLCRYVTRCQIGLAATFD